jgi:methyltransferase (TIGR00027 family)
LFDDPYAAAFAAAAGPPADGEHPDDTVPASPQRQALAFQVVIRTRYYDDYLRAAAADGCRQVVLLAAGLDTRAFRLSWPEGTTVFEADLPDLLEVKERVLAEVGSQLHSQRVVVAVDLREDWLLSLKDAGFDASQPTAWLAEGLLVYLDAADARTLLHTVSLASASGSQVAFERSARARDAAADDRAAGDTAAVTSLWRGGGVGDDVEEWLSELGWTVTVDNLGDVATSYGRAPSRATTSGFVRATR